MTNLASRTQKSPTIGDRRSASSPAGRCTWLALRGDALIWTFNQLRIHTTVVVSVGRATPCACGAQHDGVPGPLDGRILAAVPILQRPGSVLVPRSCSREPPTETGSLALGSPGAGVDHGTHSRNTRQIAGLFCFVSSPWAVCVPCLKPLTGPGTDPRSPTTDATTLTTTCAA